jgi:hypothetical protein
MAGKLGINKKGGSVSYRSVLACRPTRSSIMAERILTMPLRAAAALILTIALTTGCSAMHGDPKNPEKNPHPVKRYEVTATVDSPGPWDSVKGVVFFDVVNAECVPQDTFTGGRNVPNTSYDFEMVPIGRNTWRGYFYRDALRDDDYFGKGVCHWDATQVAPDFKVDGVGFGSSQLVDEALGSTQTDYFRKSDLSGHLKGLGSAPAFSATRPEYKKNPNGFFPITLTIKEANP